MGASMRYLSQRFAMTNRIAMGTLTDIGTEELAHLEMVAAIVHQLTRNLSMEEIEKSGFAPYYVDHTVGIWPQAGTEELAHLEMVAAIVHQLTRNLSMEEIEKSGFAPYYVDHTVGIWPQAAGGIPFNACEFQSKGDPITDLFEDMAAELCTLLCRPYRRYLASGSGRHSF